MTFEESEHPRAINGRFAEKVGSTSEVSLGSSAKPDTLVQDVKDAWDERHSKKADILFRIEEAKTAMRTATWHPAADVGSPREKDKYLSAEYRLAEALAERDASRMWFLRGTGMAGKASGSPEAAAVGAAGNGVAALISFPRTLKMFRLKRYAARHPELRELDATVNSRPETRRELIDSRASAFLREHGRPDPKAFSSWLRNWYHLDRKPEGEQTRREQTIRRDAELTLANVYPAAREAYLNNDPEQYIADMGPWQTRQANRADHW